MQSNLIRILLSALGAIVGTLMIVLVYMLSLSLFGTGPNEQFSKITLIFIIFIGSIIANNLSALFISLSDQEKYNKMQNSILHIFLFNLMLFILSLIFYLSTDQIQEVALIHIILSIMGSNILLESFGKGGKYILSGIYGTILGSFLLALILKKGIEFLNDYTLMTFVILPLSHLVISSSTVLIEVGVKKAEEIIGRKIF